MKRLFTLLLVLSLSPQGWADGFDSDFLDGFAGNDVDRYEDRGNTREIEREQIIRSTGGDTEFVYKRFDEQSQKTTVRSDEDPSYQLDDEQISYLDCREKYLEAKGRYLTLAQVIEDIKEIERDKDKAVAGKIIFGVIALAAGIAGNQLLEDDFARDLSTGVAIAGGITAGAGTLATMLNNGKYDVEALDLHNMSLRDLKNELDRYENPEVPRVCRVNGSWDYSTFTDESDNCSQQSVYERRAQELMGGDAGYLYDRVICIDPELDCQDCH